MLLSLTLISACTYICKYTHTASYQTPDVGLAAATTAVQAVLTKARGHASASRPHVIPSKHRCPLTREESAC
jgi:hypothetical protein